MKYLSILFVCIFLMNCSSVPKEYVTNNDTCGNINTLFDEPLDNGNTLPSEVLEKLKINNEFYLKDNPAFENRFSKLSDNYIANYQTYKKYNIGKWVLYNEKGNIKRSEFVYHNGYTRLYKETQFDSIGNITKIIDHEKGYNICWAEAIEIVKKIAKTEIKKYEITDYYLKRISLNRWPNEKPTWRISLEGNEEYEVGPTKVYWIDGVTGKFLKTTEITTIP